MNGSEACEACGRSCVELTRHHLVPVSQHRRMAERLSKTMDQLRQETVCLCLDCHGQLHSLVSEKDLARIYRTMEQILSHPGFAKFVKWVSVRQGSYGHRRCNARRR